MELKDFVAINLKEVEAGSESEDSNRHSYYVLDRYIAGATASDIAFDFAVSSECTKENASNISRGLKLKVISAEADKSGNKESASESTSRIQFGANPNEK